MNIITEDQVNNYQRDGYIIVPELFRSEEVFAMIHEVEGGDRVAKHTRGNEDTSGRTARLAIWGDIGEDIWGAVSTCPRVVNNVRILLGEETAFFHGKVMLKEAKSGGAWEWHQDYGYWYDQGFVFPRMMSVFVALDRATIQNGCLQVLKGSHRMGRLEHGRVGMQTGANRERFAQIEPFFERVQVELEPGSALFFHCNLLHTSGPNDSDFHRRSFIICYNALGNPVINGKNGAEDRPCPVSSEEAILKFVKSGVA